MDELNSLKELIPILAFLLPGFLTTQLIDLWVVTKPKEFPDKIVQAFVFTIVNLLCFSILRYIVESFGCCTFDHDQFFTPGNLVLMIVCSVAIALCCAYEMKNERILSFLRTENITKKTAKPSTWLDVFSNQQKFIVVHLEDGRRIYGWPSLYSDDPTEESLYLEEASWLDDDNEMLNDPRISIFLTAKSGIKLIEFLDPS